MNFVPTVSIVIVTYNSCGCIARCLSSIFSSPHSNYYQIVVVDNASQDEIGPMLALQYPSVLYIANSVNKGFGAACNQGLSFALASNILFLNPDTIVFNDSIDVMAEFLNRNSNAGACGC